MKIVLRVAFTTAVFCNVDVITQAFASMFLEKGVLYFIINTKMSRDTKNIWRLYCDHDCFPPLTACQVSRI